MSIVWDKCTLYETETLEKLQYGSARIVTGLKRYVSTTSLRRKIGWISPSDRRKIQKLNLLYKQKHIIIPCYLNDLFPEIADDIANWKLITKRLLNQYGNNGLVFYFKNEAKNPSRCLGNER